MSKLKRILRARSGILKALILTCSWLELNDYPGPFTYLEFQRLLQMSSAYEDALGEVGLP